MPKEKIKNKATGLLQEFKTFISRGNVIDMAVGVIIGTAFTAIVNSLVKDVVMPVISVITGGVDFTDWKWVITEGTEEVAECAVLYGQFIQNIINFLLIAVVVFAMVKVISALKYKKKEEEKPAEPAAPPAPPEDIVLLREIRDLLKK